MMVSMIMMVYDFKWSRESFDKVMICAVVRRSVMLI